MPEEGIERSEQRGSRKHSANTSLQKRVNRVKHRGQVHFRYTESERLVLPARHFVAVRGAEHPVGRSARPEGAAAHQCHLCRLLGDIVGQSAEAARDSCHRGQPLDPPDASRADLLARASGRASAFHANLFVLAQSVRTVARGSSGTSWLAASLYRYNKTPKPICRPRNPADRIGSTSASTIYPLLTWAGRLLPR